MEIITKYLGLDDPSIFWVAIPAIILGISYLIRSIIAYRRRAISVKDIDGSTSADTIVVDNHADTKFISKKQSENIEKTIAQHLLSYIWDYPLSGGVHSSWATKESLTLKNKLEEANANPGVGTAMFSVQLASIYFTSRAEERYDRFIAWVNPLLEPEAPYRLRIQEIDGSHSMPYWRPDFRHTIALGIIFIYMGRRPDLIEFYLKNVIENQDDDCGWEKNSNRPKSRIFSALYAVEFLTLYIRNMQADDSIKREIAIKRDKALGWIVSAANSECLWDSGTFKDKPWDNPWTTAWVVRRLSALGMFHAEIDELLQKSCLSMIRRIQSDDIWTRSDFLERFRVEARILSATTVAMRSYTNPNVQDAGRYFIAEWKKRNIDFILRLTQDQMDLATALFLLDVFASPEEIYNFSQMIV